MTRRDILKSLVSLPLVGLVGGQPSETPIKITAYDEKMYGQPSRPILLRLVASKSNCEATVVRFDGVETQTDVAFLPRSKHGIVAVPDVGVFVVPENQMLFWSAPL